MKRPTLAIATVVLTLATMGQANAETLLAYEGCYEVSVARPRPRALIDPTLPPGFTAAPFLDPALGLGAYAITGYECAVGSETVSELISGVAVNPPPEFAGAAQTLLLLQGSTSRAESAALYSSWCLSSFEHGRVTVDHQTTPAARTAVVTAEHSRGDISVTSAAPGPTPLAGPEITLRVIDVGGDQIGILDFDASAAAFTPGAAVVTIGGLIEPSPALHIVAAGDEAPNNWSLQGRCVPA